MVIEIDVIPASIDPVQVADFAGKAVAAFISRTLFRSTDWGHPVGAGILRGAVPRDGGRTWRLLTDSTAIWPNGRPLTLAEINTGLTRLPTHRRGPLGWLGSLIAGTRRAGHDAIDVTLTRPLACFPEVLTAEIFAPRPTAPNAAHALPGCYSYVGGLGGRALALRKNEVGHRLWSDGPDEVIFVVTESPEQGVRLFEHGAIDVTCNPNLPLPDLARYAGSSSLRQSDLQLGGVLLFASERLRGTDARALRRAIAGAVPRHRIAEALTGSLSPLHQLSALWEPPAVADMCGDDDHDRPSPSTGRTISLVLGYADFHPNRLVVEHIAESLRSRVGVRVEIRAFDYPAYLSCLARPTVDLLYSLVQPAYPDPTSLLASLRASGWIDLRRPDFDATLAEAEQTCDPDARLAACRRVEAIMSEEAPLVPVIRATSKCLVSGAASALAFGADGIFRPPVAPERTAS